METKDKLDKLYGLQQMQFRRQQEKMSLIESVTPEEVRKKIQEIEDEYADDGILTKIAQLEREIKDEVLALGTKVTGKYLIVTYNKGRVSWDASALDAYALSHPEILQFRKQGDPSTSLRKIS